MDGNESTVIRESHARGRITKAERVQRLVDAHHRVQTALNEEKAPRLAAKILVEELRALAKTNEPFWIDIRDASKRPGDHRQEEVLVSISDLVEADARIFGGLGIDQSQSAPIIALVYGGLRQAAVRNLGVQPESLQKLRRLVSEATDFICAGNNGPVRHAQEWLVSWHGARVLAGAATCLANAAGVVPATVSIASAGTNAIPVLFHDSICWISIRAGVNVMTADLEGILDLDRYSAGDDWQPLRA
jgi:rhodanese-related sulfurtransferase